MYRQPAAIRHYKKENVDPSSYIDAVSQEPNLSLSQRRSAAERHTKTPISWSCEIPRTREGYYHFRAGISASTKRAVEFGRYADLLWVETGDPQVAKAQKIARTVRSQFPGKKLVYNLSPSFNWLSAGFTEKQLKSFIWDIAKEG